MKNTITHSNNTLCLLYFIILKCDIHYPHILNLIKYYFYNTIDKKYINYELFLFKFKHIEKAIYSIETIKKLLLNKTYLPNILTIDKVIKGLTKIIPKTKLIDNILFDFYDSEKNDKLLNFDTIKNELDSYNWNKLSLKEKINNIDKHNRCYINSYNLLILEIHYTDKTNFILYLNPSLEMCYYQFCRNKNHKFKYKLVKTKRYDFVVNELYANSFIKTPKFYDIYPMIISLYTNNYKYQYKNIYKKKLLDYSELFFN